MRCGTSHIDQNLLSKTFQGAYSATSKLIEARSSLLTRFSFFKRRFWFSANTRRVCLWSEQKAKLKNY